MGTRRALPDVRPRTCRVTASRGASPAEVRSTPSQLVRRYPGGRRPVGRSGGIVLGLHLGLRGAAAPPVASRPSGVADGPVPTLGARGKPDTDLRYPGGHRGPTV